MTPTTDFQPIFVVKFVVVCIFLWILTTFIKLFNNNKYALRDQRKLSTWMFLNGITSFFHWSLDKCASKTSLIEQLTIILKRFTAQCGGTKIIKIFNTTLIFNDDKESIKNVLNDNIYNAKIPDTMADILSNGHQKGLLHNDGPSWRELRKFTIKKLGELGFGKTDKLFVTFSERLPCFVNDFESIRESSGNKIPIKNLFMVHVINVIWGIIGGHHFSQNDEDFLTLMHNLDTITNFPIWKMCLVTLLPSNKVIRNLFGLNPFFDGIVEIHEYFKKFVEDKIKSDTSGADPDFVEHFLNEMAKHQNNADLKHIYCKEQLIVVLVDLFSAGMDTTSKYLELSLMYMILNPNVQRKVQEEIDIVIGHDFPSYCDYRQSTPYVCATLMEVHRMASIIPTIGRYIPNSFVNKGEMVEKGTEICNVMWAVRMDETLWGDPYSFRPERFLDNSNNLIMEKVNLVMPFSTGIRMCPGENVSVASSYTFFVGVFQKYTLTKADESEVLGIEKGCGIITQTLPFHISANNR